jgi:hypothetical protein
VLKKGYQQQKAKFQEEEEEEITSYQPKQPD